MKTYVSAGRQSAKQPKDIRIFVAKMELRSQGGIDPFVLAALYRVLFVPSTSEAAMKIRNDLFEEAARCHEEYEANQ